MCIGLFPWWPQCWWSRFTIPKEWYTKLHDRHKWTKPRVVTSFTAPPSSTAFSTLTVTCAVASPLLAGATSEVSSGSNSLRMMNHVFTCGADTVHINSFTPATNITNHDLRHNQWSLAWQSCHICNHNSWSTWVHLWSTIVSMVTSHTIFFDCCHTFKLSAYRYSMQGHWRVPYFQRNNALNNARQVKYTGSSSIRSLSLSHTHSSQDQ